MKNYINLPLAILFNKMQQKTKRIKQKDLLLDQDRLKINQCNNKSL